MTSRQEAAAAVQRRVRRPVRLVGRLVEPPVGRPGDADVRRLPADARRLLGGRLLTRYATPVLTAQRRRAVFLVWLSGERDAGSAAGLRCGERESSCSGMIGGDACR